MASGPGVSVFDAFNRELHEIINKDANVTDTVAFYDTYAPHFQVMEPSALVSRLN